MSAMVLNASTRFLPPAVLGLVVLALFAISYSDYVFSSFLIADDNIVIPSALFGETEIEPNSPGRSLLVALGGLTGSIAFVKALALLFFPAIAVLCYVIARQVGAGQLAAACIALFIVTFPVAVEQPYFVSGAHPTMATVFGLAAIASFLRSYDDERRFRNAFAASFFLCVVAAAFSPQMFLFPAAPIAWAAAALAFGRIRLRQFVIAVAITGPIVLIAGYVAYKSHHYGGLVGWTEISVSNVLANLVEVLSRPIETILAQDLSIRIAHALLVLVLIGLAAVAFIGRDRSAASAVDGRAKRGHSCLSSVSWPPERPSARCRSPRVSPHGMTCRCSSSVRWQFWRRLGCSSGVSRGRLRRRSACCWLSSPRRTCMSGSRLRAQCTALR